MNKKINEKFVILRGTVYIRAVLYGKDVTTLDCDSRHIH